MCLIRAVTAEEQETTVCISAQLNLSQSGRNVLNRRGAAPGRVRLQNAAKNMEKQTKPRTSLQDLYKKVYVEFGFRFRHLRKTNTPKKCLYCTGYNGYYTV